MSGVHDSWLVHYYGERLEQIDARCRREPLDCRWLADIDDDVWAILLSREYDVFPNLRDALPDLPAPELQETWNGRSGMALTTQSLDFYKKLKALYARHGAGPLADAAVLDFGCGWGRLTRLIARDVAPEQLCGCDPDPQILSVCEQTRVPGRLRYSSGVPDALPFDDVRFDLVYAFSVFTHLSEHAHLACLGAIHAGLAPGGLLIATVRPPAYVALGLDVGSAKARGLDSDLPAYAFVPHGGPLPDYGEAIVNLPYVRERWAERFELVEVSLLLDDLYQVVLTLRRR